VSIDPQTIAKIDARVRAWELEHGRCWYWNSEPPYRRPCGTCPRCQATRSRLRGEREEGGS
jgi:hypothetical protein